MSSSPYVISSKIIEKLAFFLEISRKTRLFLRALRAKLSEIHKKTATSAISFRNSHEIQRNLSKIWQISWETATIAWTFPEKAVGNRRKAHTPAALHGNSRKRARNQGKAWETGGFQGPTAAHSREIAETRANSRRNRENHGISTVFRESDVQFPGKTRRNREKRGFLRRRPESFEESASESAVFGASARKYAESACFRGGVQANSDFFQAYIRRQDDNRGFGAKRGDSFEEAREFRREFRRFFSVFREKARNFARETRENGDWEGRRAVRSLRENGTYSLQSAEFVIVFSAEWDVELHESHLRMHNYLHCAGFLGSEERFRQVFLRFCGFYQVLSRMLIGFRYWSEFGVDFKEKWFFETYCDKTYKENKMNTRFFWISQTVFSIIWFLYAVYELFSLDIAMVWFFMVFYGYFISFFKFFMVFYGILLVL